MSRLAPKSTENMNSEIRFLVLVAALLMLWAATSMVRESGVHETVPVVTSESSAQPSDIRLKE